MKVYDPLNAIAVGWVTSMRGRDDPIPTLREYMSWKGTWGGPARSSG